MPTNGTGTGSYAGKVAFVTGAASGIGRATALAFAREGAGVVVADVAEQGNQDTARMIEDIGDRALAVRCDVTRAADVTAALDTAVATDLASDTFLGYSTWKWADLHGRTGSQPVYRYLYAHPRPPVRPEMGDAVGGLAGGVLCGADAEAQRMPPTRRTSSISWVTWQRIRCMPGRTRTSSSRS